MSGDAVPSAGRPLHVVVAPDSFKGSADAADIARAMAAGWRDARPADHVTVLPQADGGEGTMAALAASTGGARWHAVSDVCGPDHRPVTARWLELPGSLGVVELAESSGLPLMASLDPRRATSRGLGQVIRAAVGHGAQRLVVGLGGSASTDGGVGMLRELGLVLLDDGGRPVTIDDVTGLAAVARVDVGALLAAPPGGVEVLTDTLAPLYGPDGAAHTFGAQKGADAETRDALDRALRRIADAIGPPLGADASEPGTGAAGGVGFGLRAWGARLVPGADRINHLTGLTDAIPTADVVVTGEGRFDSTSATGKLVGTIVRRCTAHGVRTLVVAGDLAVAPPDLGVSLVAVAGSVEAALAEPLTHARSAVRAAAASI
ncbi:glycerate kinase [Tsukamurella soli]|uniref:Glycerate kinase n=1 Tax=Tsukamurella soli TaxID=644556 RepID=A0ABP8J9M9_9ACTN